MATIIPASQVRQLYTQASIDVYQQRLRAPSLLRGLFPAVYTGTKYASIDIERIGEDVAVDIERGTEGNRNKFSLSTQKIFEPPYYAEYYDVTQEAIYDQVLGAAAGNGVTPELLAQFTSSVANRMGVLQDKIERAIELMCVSILETGKVTLKDGNVIDFKRKSASIVNPGAGNYWANNVDLYTQLDAAGNFIRSKGKTSDDTFNIIMGASAFAKMRENTVFKGRQDTVNMKLDNVMGPMRTDNSGGVFHGTISSDNYRFQLWTYPQFYKNTSGVDTAYLNDKLVTIVPTTPRFKTAFCAVPQLVQPGGGVAQQGPYVIDNKRDEWNTTDLMRIRCAPLPIPTAIDTIYTLRAVE